MSEKEREGEKGEERVRESERERVKPHLSEEHRQDNQADPVDNAGELERIVNWGEYILHFRDDCVVCNTHTYTHKHTHTHTHVCLSNHVPIFQPDCGTAL